MNHKVLILCVFVLLVALSIVGTMFVHKQGDVIAYLKDDTDTMIGKKVLEDEYGIIGDGAIAVSYLSETQVKTLIKKLDAFNESEFSRYYAKSSVPAENRRKIISKTVWVGTFDNLELLDSLGIDMGDSLAFTREKFIKHGTDAQGRAVDTYIISLYFSAAGSDDRTIDALDGIDAIFSEYIDQLRVATETFRADHPTLPVPSTGKAADKYLQIDAGDADQYYYIGGSAQNARVLLESSIGDMPIFFAVAVAAVFVILLITSHSYLEPLIFLATLGISLLLNMGSNIVAGIPLGTISSITSSCSTILQLAIAMDYSIFLMHTYYEELPSSLTPKDALIKALPKTISAVAASALTTVGGFVALFFMQYGMGYDLGFVLAKGVLLSLFSVVFLQPILICLFGKAVKKTEHKWKVEIRLKPIAKVVTKRGIAIALTAVCVAIAIPCAYFQTQAPLNYITMTKDNPNPSHPEAVAGELNNQLIVMVPYYYTDEGIDKQFEFADRLKRIGYLQTDGHITLDAQGNPVADADLAQVTEVFSLFTVLGDRALFDRLDASFMRTIVYRQLHASFISDLIVYDQDNNPSVNDDPNFKHYALYTVNLTGKAEDPQSFASLLAVRELAMQTFGEVKVTGLAQGAYDLSLVTPRDFAVVNIASALIIFLILLVTFRKPVLSILLLFVIETGIFINLTLVFLVGVQINFMAYLIVSAIELGATVDYAILVTSKYLEEKKLGHTGTASVKNAIYRAAPSVLTSGTILVAVCVCVRLVTSNVIVSQITELIARGALLSLLLVFTLLPAILSIKETLSRKWYLKRGKGDPDEGKDATTYCDLSKAERDRIFSAQPSPSSASVAIPLLSPVLRGSDDEATVDYAPPADYVDRGTSHTTERKS